MDFGSFVNNSGLKVLAMTKLGPCEYSIMIYLLNCAASGLNEFITTEREFSSLMGYKENEIRDATATLASKHMIHLKFGEKHHQVAHRQSMRIGFQFDTKEWTLDFESEVDSKDAIVFPFRRDLNTHLVGLPETSHGHQNAKITKPLATWKRVFREFSSNRELGEKEQKSSEQDAKMLVETHPVDQVLLILKHFKDRIPTLSLLASSWQHYQEVFEAETEKVDFMDARQKHFELDEKLRKAVVECLEEREQLELTKEEVGVLDILFSHRHPRRQLFWAYQARSRYPNLAPFFNENARHMLPVTSNGLIIKKKPHRD